jgi:hypothetical protein
VLLPLNVQPASAALPRANSDWDTCNSHAVAETPPVVWARIHSATDDHKGIPKTFWTSTTYRDDIVKIICYESTFEYHAENSGHYGWFQMGYSLIESEGITFHGYWNGLSHEAAGWWQCTAGEIYIAGRYGNPAVAWKHEAIYGWYIE